MKFFASLAAAAALFETAASLATAAPGPTFSVGIPTANTKNLYIQMKGPSTYNWIGLGIGSKMSGSAMFIIYADGKGNVTLSPRKGTGHVEPKYDSTMKVQLLAGSGVVGGNLVANILCTSCGSLYTATSTSSAWIAGWNSGASLASTSTSASIAQHSNANAKSFTFDLTKAAMAADSNPFLTTGTSATASGTASGSSASGTDRVVGGSSSSFSNAFSEIQGYQMSHGIIMSAVVAVLFPLGAIIMKTTHRPWVHGIFQLVTLVLLIAGFGLGVKLANMTFGGSAFAARSVVAEVFKHKRQLGGNGDNPFDGSNPFASTTTTAGTGAATDASTSGSSSSSSSSSSSGLTNASSPFAGGIFNITHVLFGTVIFGLFLLQPIFGIIHHMRYVRTQRRGFFGYLHTWYGRIVMLLGVVNGGLGFQLAANTKSGEIAYGVVAGFMGVAYIGVVIAAAVRGKARPRRGDMEPISDAISNSMRTNFK